MVIKAIALDFDNTLILNPETGEGSEEVKDKAWEGVFYDCDPSDLAEVIAITQKKIAGGKGDRSDIIRAVLSHMNVSAEVMDSECLIRNKLFNEFVQNGILEIGVSDAVRNTLISLSRKFELFINTATPTPAVLESLSGLGIEDYFTSVYGRPGTKEENLIRISKDSGIEMEHILFVDDSTKAADIAQRLGVQFIGIKTARNADWHKTKQSFPVVASVGGILRYIRIY